MITHLKLVVYLKDIQLSYRRLCGGLFFAKNHNIIYVGFYATTVAQRALVVAFFSFKYEIA